MKKKWKYLLGAGAIALGVYALWPSNENLETKVEEPVETYNIDKAELRKRFLEINKKIKLPEEVKEEEDSDLPSCLQCDDWRPKVKPEWYDNGQLKLEKTYCCGELHGKQKYWYKNGQLEKIEEYFCGKKEGEHIKWHENGEKWVEGRYHNGKEEGKWVISSENCYGDRMEIIADYANGKKHGKEFRFEDGRLTREMDYKFDERDGKDIRARIVFRGIHLRRFKGKPYQMSLSVK